MGRSARLTDRSCNELWLSIVLLLVVSVRLLLRRVKAALSKPGRVGTFHAWGSHFFQAVLQLRENHLPLQPISLFSADNYLQAVVSCRFPMASRTQLRSECVRLLTMARYRVNITWIWFSTKTDSIASFAHLHVLALRSRRTFISYLMPVTSTAWKYAAATMMTTNEPFCQV